MATISISIPDDKINDVREAFALMYEWNAGLGITKTAFAKQKVAEYIKMILKEGKAREAATTARSANESIDIN